MAVRAHRCRDEETQPVLKITCIQDSIDQAKLMSAILQQKSAV